MKVEIKKHTETIETIDVKFPFYFCHDMTGDDHYTSCIYGKIEDGRTVTIHERLNAGKSKTYEIDSEYKPIKESGNYSYLTNRQYTSTKKEFDDCFGRFIAFLNTSLI